ncbi:hypothetical protein [Actinomadura flavalba]|uniref:hypothetical protein n=1 Tax=Actinomadura flavalba TaxID=1120938 RepID=UPI001F0A4CD0|nr:hypothetical protein [Actinomadura flavalba]
MSDSRDDDATARPPTTEFRRGRHARPAEDDVVFDGRVPAPSHGTRPEPLPAAPETPGAESPPENSTPSPEPSPGGPDDAPLPRAARLTTPPGPGPTWEARPQQDTAESTRPSSTPPTSTDEPASGEAGTTTASGMNRAAPPESASTVAEQPEAGSSSDASRTRPNSSEELAAGRYARSAPSGTDRAGAEDGDARRETGRHRAGGAEFARVSEGAAYPVTATLGRDALPASASGQWATPWAGEALPVDDAPPVGGTPQADEDDASRRRRRWPFVVVLVAVLLVAGAVAGQLLRPVPEPRLRLALPATHTFAGRAPTLAWPSTGQAAVHVEGLGTMGSSGAGTPIPTASVAKVMTAYVYLRDHPLADGEDGPVRAVSEEGVSELPGRVARDESRLGITSGQRLSERKALESVLLISANDVAVELARWDSGGDVPAFVAKMNEAARQLGMTSTTYTDPAGYDAATVSTPADQVLLLRAAMRVPAFARIVGQRVFDPEDGTGARNNGNVLLGRLGVIGGKTGYTDRAGGNFVFAARHRVGGVSTLVYGAVMGQRSTSAMAAMAVAQQLVTGAERALTATRLAPAGEVVAQVDDGLGGRTPLRAAAPVTVVGWPGLTVPVRADGDPPHRAATGTTVGVLRAGPSRVDLTPARPLDGPSLQHRLLRLR